MVVYFAHEAAQKPAPAEKQKKTAASLRKMSFNDKYELETLPARMTELEREIAAVHAELSDSTLYARDPKAFARASGQLERAWAALSAAEERWLELEALRLELAGE